jgi:hypothetical protein
MLPHRHVGLIMAGAGLGRAWMGLSSWAFGLPGLSPGWEWAHGWGFRITGAPVGHMAAGGPRIIITGAPAETGFQARKFGSKAELGRACMDGWGRAVTLLGWAGLG